MARVVLSAQVVNAHVVRNHGAMAADGTEASRLAKLPPGRRTHNRLATLQPILKTILDRGAGMPTDKGRDIACEALGLQSLSDCQERALPKL